MKTIESLLKNHDQVTLLLNEMACMIKQLETNVDSLQSSVARLQIERDRLQNDLEFYKLGEK